MAWQSSSYPASSYPDRSPSMGGLPPPPPREAGASPGRRGDGMQVHSSRSMHRSEGDVVYRGSHAPMPPPLPPPRHHHHHHREYSRRPPSSSSHGPPPRHGAAAPFHAESPPRYHSYPPGFQQPIHSSRSMYYGEPSPPPPEYDMDMRHSGGCTCKKSKCLKLYCQCFASSLTCGPRCKCRACHNTTMHGSAIEEARRVILERNPSAFEDKFVKDQPLPPPPLPHEHVRRFQYWQPREQEESYGSPTRKHKSGCKCRRSYCLKKYCECFHHGARCGDMCRCINCKNKPSEEQPSPERPNHGATVPLPKEVMVKAAVDSEMNFEKAKVNRYEMNTEILGDRDTDSEKVAHHPEQHGEEQPEKESPDKKEETDRDRMAIMAAVAMTELFGTKSDKPEEKEHPETVNRLVSVEDKEEEQPEQKWFNRKRMSSSKQEPPHKKLKPLSPTPDDEVRAVVSSSSSHVSASPSMDSHGSRESPVSGPRGGGAFPPRYFGYYNSYGAPPRGMGPIETLPPPPQQPILHRRSPVGDAQMNGSLPKSLSFRKICSKCGKTRGEHGELGFGNKCVYQDCGRCGAGVQMHVKAKCPMGFLCTLSVKDGATPGAAEAYERKIHDLAVRAELQRGLALAASPRHGVKAL